MRETRIGSGSAGLGLPCKPFGFVVPYCEQIDDE